NDFDPDCGPLLTTIRLDENVNFEPVGELKAINAVTKRDEVFGCDVKIFKKKGEFRQRIKLKGGPVTIAGVIEGQVCTEIDGKCVPSEEDFSFLNLGVADAVSKNPGNGAVKPAEKKRAPEPV